MTLLDIQFSGHTVESDSLNLMRKFQMINFWWSLFVVVNALHIKKFFVEQILYVMLIQCPFFSVTVWAGIA